MTIIYEADEYSQRHPDGDLEVEQEPLAGDPYAAMAAIWILDAVATGPLRNYAIKSVTEDGQEYRISHPKLSRAVVIRDENTQDTRAEVYDPDKHDAHGAPVLPFKEVREAVDRAYEVLGLDTYTHRKRARVHWPEDEGVVTEDEARLYSLQKLQEAGFRSSEIASEIEAQIKDIEKKIKDTPESGEVYTEQEITGEDGIGWD